MGERLAAAALAIGYGRNATSAWGGAAPRAVRVSASVTAPAATTLSIALIESTGANASGLAFVNVSWNAQTSPGATTSNGFEVATAASYASNLTGAVWTSRGVVAAVGAGGSSVAVTYTVAGECFQTTVTTHFMRESADSQFDSLPLIKTCFAHRRAVGVVIGVRYLWQETPHSFILYSNGGAPGALPAQPWIAKCDGSKCHPIAPGQVPSSAGPKPMPPGHAPGPAPPAPPSSACTFANNTVVTDGAILGELSVAFLDQDACCGACRAFALLGRGECAVAQLMGSGTTHGAPSEWHSRCILYGATGVKTEPSTCSWPCARVEVKN